MVELRVRVLRMHASAAAIQTQINWSNVHGEGQFGLFGGFERRPMLEYVNLSARTGSWQGDMTVTQYNPLFQGRFS